ncbi:MAG: hypothetical protein SXQ77_02305, partial [Halobacteria archaeon]|nr:hypothetical protein [Halobacteria archaeon]
FVNATGILDTPIQTIQQTVHFYAVGFAALLIFALGVRLLTGFFHVSIPRYAVRLVIVPGALAPAFLGTYLWMWVDPWFQVGAVLETVGMVGYLGTVMFVAYRSDTNNVGLYGILLGAVSGVIAVVLVFLYVLGIGGAVIGTQTTYVSGHVSFVLGGFFPLTIVGYAYQFFPVTGGQFRGANRSTATATVGLLGTGVLLQGGSAVVEQSLIVKIGAAISLVGAVGYWYLITRRLST